MPARAHFLDVGAQEYGDCVLCELAGLTVLIDGAHPGNQVSSQGHRSIPEQLETLLRTSRPLEVDLLVITHAHADHIGCIPALVKDGTLRARWALVADPALSWGRSADDDSPDRAQTSPVAAAMREEIPSAHDNDQVVAQVLLDAVNLEHRYSETLMTLAEHGQVVRYGRDDIQPLLAEFAPAGLDILGPSQAQLLLCADAIARTTQDLVDRLNGLESSGDLPESEVGQYRRLLRPSGDLVDARDRPGPAINLQSTVTLFAVGDVKMLFAGDMQLADPQIGGDALANEVAALRAKIRAHAPYDVVKLCHHGSDNGFDQSVQSDFAATHVYGICAGELSTAHPNPAVLQLLDQERDQLTWVRTDRNGLSTVEVTGSRPHISIDHGTMNDPRPNTQDEPVGQVTTAPATTQTVVTGSSEEVIEVVTRVPRGARVALTIDATADTAQMQPTSRPLDRFDPLLIAGGRELPRLLVATGADQLATNVGALEAQRVLDAVSAHPSLVLYDSLRAGVSADEARAAITEQLGRNERLHGVVLLGGLDVLPSHRRDVLPPRLGAKVRRTEDPDDFIVWSDETYGDSDGDGIAELPVSRIPDGRSVELLFGALSATNSRRRDARQGVRNAARPFAEDVFGLIPGNEALLVSNPATPLTVPALRSDLVYVMLHGDFGDSSRYWGEDDSGRPIEAVNVSNVPDVTGRIVLAGCCWGALTVEQPANRAHPNAPPAPKPVASSLALSFLLRGATAFVGCTGVHYSPQPPGDYFGGPMHKEFLKAIFAGRAPALALFEAKQAYAAAIPHRAGGPTDEAIELKILNEFTCLGLGW